MIRTISVNGFELDCAIFGTGTKPFVIIPGLSLKSVMLSAAAVAAAYSGFGSEFTVYLFDVRKDLPEKYSLPDFADDIAAAMNALGIANASVFGASMGGLVSLLLAARYPGLVSRLAVSSTLCRSNDVSRATFAEWHGLAEARDTGKLVPSMLDRIYSEATLKKYRKSLLAMFEVLSEEELSRCEVLTAALRDADYSDTVAQITCPVLAIGAEDDRVLGVQGTKELAGLLNCEVYLYPAPYGHAIYDEAPDFQARLRAFFCTAGTSAATHLF